MDSTLYMLIIMSIMLGLGGWTIHLYTLIRSYFSDNKWVVRVSFNECHEAIPELIIFTGVIILMGFTIITFIMGGL